jgi:hypothetical protein
MFGAGGPQVAALLCCAAVPAFALVAFAAVQLAQWASDDDPDDPDEPS